MRPAGLVIETTPAGLHARWPAPRAWGSVLFLAVGWVAWLVGEIVAALVLWAEPMTSFLILWFVLWTLGGCVLGASLVWQLFGREVILMDGATLEHRLEALGLVRSRVYVAAAITALRTTERFVSPWVRWPFVLPPVFGPGWGCVAFDYGGTTARLGLSLDEQEASRLLAEMLGRLPKGLADFQHPLTRARDHVGDSLLR